MSLDAFTQKYERESTPQLGGHLELCTEDDIFDFIRKISNMMFTVLVAKITFSWLL